MSKKISNLTTDPQILGQSWVCLSFLTPESVKMKTDVRSVKVRGVYGTEDEARKRCEDLRSFDPNFNIYVAPVGHWLPWCDDPEKASDFDYANKKLDELMKGYQENRSKAKLIHEERKNKMVKKSLKEIEQKNNKKSLIEIESVDAELVKMAEKELALQKEKKEIDQGTSSLEESENKLKEQQTELKKTEKNIKNIDDELHKAEELYNKLMTNSSQPSTNV